MNINIIKTYEMYLKDTLSSFFFEKAQKKLSFQWSIKVVNIMIKT